MMKFKAILPFTFSAVVLTMASLACEVDLQFRCNQDSYLLVNPDPLGCTDVRAYREDGTECDSSIEGSNSEIITINKCDSGDVIIEMVKDDDLTSCNISCDEGDRSVNGFSLPIYFVLQAQSVIRSGTAHYACHGSDIIFMRNPRPELFTHSVGHSLDDSLVSCDVTHTLKNTVIVASNCDSSMGVVIATGAVAGVSFMIGRKTDLFLLHCGPPGQLVDSDVSHGMEYDCYDDNTVVATNPRKDLFFYGFSEVNGVTCSLLFVNNNAKIMISGCDISHYMLILLSKMPIDEAFIARPNNIFFVHCDMPDEEDK